MAAEAEEAGGSNEGDAPPRALVETGEVEVVAISLMGATRPLLLPDPPLPL